MPTGLSNSWRPHLVVYLAKSAKISLVRSFELFDFTTRGIRDFVVSICWLKLWPTIALLCQPYGLPVHREVGARRLAASAPRLHRNRFRFLVLELQAQID